MKKEKKIAIKGNGISIRTAVFLFTLILLVVVSITKFIDVREQHNRLTAENVALKKEKESLQAELDKINKEANNLDSKVYIESVARTHLDMVYPDEIIFHVSEN